VRRFLAAALFAASVVSVVAPAAATINAVQINDIANFAIWAKTATPQAVVALEGGSVGWLGWAMRPSVPTGHTLTICTIADWRVPASPHGVRTGMGAGCFGPSAAMRNAQTQASCRRSGIAAITPQLPGFIHAWHGGSVTDPTTVDVWTLGHSRLHFRCLRTGTWGYGITPEFDIVLELSVGSNPFHPY
jgi:hypothetical protein